MNANLPSAPDGQNPDGAPAEAALRQALARGDAMLRSAPQMLRHLLSIDRSALFSEEVVAKVRGMLGDVAQQLLGPEMQGLEAGDGDAHDRLTTSLAENGALLGHIHGLVLEGQMTESLRRRLSLDPVLSPLCQALIASEDAATADTAMRWLAAQARFCQNQRRMQLPLSELPPEVLHAALAVAHTQRIVEAADTPAGAAHHANEHHTAIRATYDEGATREGLAARLVAGMGGGMGAALALTHAGFGLFATALARATGQDRDVVVQSLQPGLALRAALSLRAAGVRQEDIAPTLLALDPAAGLPEGFGPMAPEHAAAILAQEER